MAHQKQAPLFHNELSETRDLINSVAQSADINVEAPPKRIRTSAPRITLHEATRMGQLETVTRLLDEGESPDKQIDGATPLRIAALAGHINICKLLLSRGADVGLSYSMDRASPLHCAALMGRIDICQLLLDWGADINQRGRFGGSALFPAALHGHVELTKFLLSRGARVDLCSFPGSTGSGSALHAACIAGHYEVCKILLEHGHNPDCLRQDGVTPLCFAANDGSVPLCVLLLSYGANVNVVTKDGMTPLCYAADGGSLDCCLLLLQHNALVDGADVENAISPLYCAVCSNSSAICHALLIAGADPLRKSRGETAYETALRYNFLDIAALINAFLEGQFNYM